MKVRDTTHEGCGGAAMPLGIAIVATPRTAQRCSLYERLGKPALDALLASLLLLLLAPVLLVVTSGVLLSIGAPVLFRQERVGRDGRVFRVYKFRTMIPDRRQRREAQYPGPERRQRHKSANDPRVTGVGHALRKFSLDELPQLWNVLRGEMSLVGPRPELVEIVERHYEPWQLERHQVKPGLTGMWQVSERASGLIYENVDLDLQYVEKLSLWTDLKILARTLKAVTGRVGAY